MKLVQNYAGTQKAWAKVHRPHSTEDILEIVKQCREDKRPITIRGGSLSYGDSAMPAENALILETAGLNKIIEFNEAEKTIRVQSGVQLGEILLEVMPRNLMLPVVPGEHRVTVGGAIANNVHGKWSWRFGNFGSCVTQMKVLYADGRVEDISELSHPELFRSIISGGGIIALILEATIQLVSIPSPYVDVWTVSVPNIEASIEALHTAKKDSDLFLSWVDMFPKDASLGRGFIEKGKFAADAKKCSREEVYDSLFAGRKIAGTIGFENVWSFLKLFWGRRFVRLLNKYIFWSGWLRSRQGKPQRMLVTDFLFIHKKVPELRRVYGRHGYYEFQPMIPTNAKTVRELIEMCQEHKFESLLCAIKLHRSDLFNLSYEGDGASVGIDVHAGEKSPKLVKNFLDHLCQFVSTHNGKMFLAKDQWVDNKWIPDFFPRARIVKALRSEVDPQHLFSTRQSERTLSEPTL